MAAIIDRDKELTNVADLVCTRALCDVFRNRLALLSKGIKVLESINDEEALRSAAELRKAQDMLLNEMQQNEAAHD